MVRFVGLFVLATTLVFPIATTAQHAANVLRRGDSASQAHRLEQVAATAPLGRVTKLRLINADTNQPIAAYDPLPAKALVDVATLPTANLNIEAVTEGSVASMLWLFNGERRTEDSPLWAYCGNNGADFYACQRLRVGMNATISATPYSAKGANGTAGQGVSVELGIVTSTTPPPTILTFTLMNADTDMEMGPLVNDTIIDLSKTPRVNVRANVVPSTLVKSVQFALNGNNVRVENGAPFALASNNGVDYFAWTPPVGRHVIAGTAFGAHNAQGTVLSTASVSIVVQTTTAPIAAPTSTPVAPPRSTAAPISAPVMTPITFAPVPAPTLAPKAAVPTLVPISPSTRGPVHSWTDFTRPELLKLVFFNPTVDVSDGPASFVIQVTAKDDATGISYCKLWTRLESYRYSGEPTVRVDRPRLDNDNIAEFNVTLNFSAYIRAGNYTLQVTLQDGNSNQLAVDYAQPIQVINSREDRSPPEVLQFLAVPPTTVDVSNGPKTASFAVELEDLGFGVDTARVVVATNQYVSGGQWFETSVARTSFVVWVNFPIYLKPGNYSLQLEVFDDYNNKGIVNATELARRGFSSSIEVLNQNPDVTPPQLVNFATSSPRTVNGSAGGNGVIAPYYSMTFSDNETGALNICMKATYDTNRTLEKCMVRCISNRQWCPHEVVNLPIKGLYTFGTFFTFNPGSWRGNCSLSVYLNDSENNKVNISSEELTARGFPGYFTIV